MITPSHLIHPCSHSTGQVPWHVSPSKLTPLVTQISASLQPSASTSPWHRCSVSLHNNGHCCKVQSSPLLLTCFGIHNDGTEQSVIGSLGTSHSFSLFSHSSGQKPGHVRALRPCPFSTQWFCILHPLSSTPPGHSIWVSLWQLALQITGQSSPASLFSGP